MTSQAITSPGACRLCRDLQRGIADPEIHDVRSHHACEIVTSEMLDLEAKGAAGCEYDGTSWTWTVEKIDPFSTPLEVENSQKLQSGEAGFLVETQWIGSPPYGLPRMTIAREPARPGMHRGSFCAENIRYTGHGRARVIMMAGDQATVQAVRL